MMILQRNLGNPPEGYCKLAAAERPLVGGVNSKWLQLYYTPLMTVAEEVEQVVQ